MVDNGGAEAGGINNARQKGLYVFYNGCSLESPVKVKQRKDGAEYRLESSFQTAARKSVKRFCSNSGEK